MGASRSIKVEQWSQPSNVTDGVYLKVIGDPGVSLAKSQNDQTIQTDININHVMYIAMFMIQNCIDQGLSKCTPKARGIYQGISKVFPFARLATG